MMLNENKTQPLIGDGSGARDLQRAELDAAIARGMADVEAGRVLTIDQSLGRLRAHAKVRRAKAA